jgi:hypothetical protein
VFHDLNKVTPVIRFNVSDITSEIHGTIPLSF